jgi:hypothetical protein
MEALAEVAGRLGESRRGWGDGSHTRDPEHIRRLQVAEASERQILLTLVQERRP